MIRRRDILEQIASNQIANWSHKWHDIQEGDVVGQLKLNLGRVANEARLILQSEALVLKCLRATTRLIAIDYEDLYSEGIVNPRLLRALQDKLGIDLPLRLAPSIKKNALDKRLLISNYDEVAESINEVLRRFPRAKIENQIP